jgi:hypothetical protein
VDLNVLSIVLWYLAVHALVLVNARVAQTYMPREPALESRRADECPATECQESQVHVRPADLGRTGASDRRLQWWQSVTIWEFNVRRQSLLRRTWEQFGNRTAQKPC